MFERDAASEEVFSQCADKNDGCADWAEHGECTKNAAYMLEACPLRYITNQHKHAYVCY